MTAAVSPLAPKVIPDPDPIAGVRFAVTQAGVKYKGRTDLMLALLDPGTAAAGVFTQSKCPSAPVDWCRAVLPTGMAQALVVNSGNANAFTGQAGAEAAAATAKAVARAAGCPPEEVYLASTGVIGEPLPAGRITARLDAMAGKAGMARPVDAARAMMTTDTFPKVAEASARISGKPVRINGIAKGAGMIAPDMATMLAFVFTDAAIEPAALQALLERAVRPSFNCISVDSDTSTSDTVLMFATGAARGAPLVETASDRRLVGFRRALNAVMLDLACQVVRDGEGASKFLTVSVTGAKSARSAKRVAFAIANSPLVKTAIAGEDANWGRVVMAIGKAGEPADRDRLVIRFGDLLVAERGARVPGYLEAEGAAYMMRDEIEISVDLGVGKSRAKVYGCDLTKDYVAINGDYRS